MTIYPKYKKRKDLINEMVLKWNWNISDAKILAEFEFEDKRNRSFFGLITFDEVYLDYKEYMQ